MRERIGRGHRMGAKRNAAAAIAAAFSLAAARAAAQMPDVVPPKATHDDGVAYPEQAARDGVTGETTVVLRLVVDASGQVTDAEVETPAGHGFDEAALAAARTLRFAPATRDGIPVVARIRFRYVFRPPPPPAFPASEPAPAPPEATPAPAPVAPPAADTPGPRPPKESSFRAAARRSIRSTGRSAPTRCSTSPVRAGT